MGLTSIWHWLVVLVIVLLVFGAGKLPKVAGDLAKGIKNFKAGLKDEDAAQAETPRQVVHEAASPANPGPAVATTDASASATTASRPAETARG
ncbi:MAG TPA: twin-arginine translocase TatA/TatE family subunit [Azospirillaceae bacterium]|nr:twin-arginine translocase TatA/TatE family subunit [Azospirillaceae bacterium]